MNYWEIERLYDLIQKGILTQEEFEVKKRQILGL
ncbi:MAG: SHOCT domain-containing protein [Lachnospiraceae bacterium]